MMHITNEATAAKSRVLNKKILLINQDVIFLQLLAAHDAVPHQMESKSLFLNEHKFTTVSFRLHRTEIFAVHIYLSGFRRGTAWLKMAMSS